MEYENIDEAARYQEACKRVRQIAKAIEKIVIKNYINWKGISVEDKQEYDALNRQIKTIAEENGLIKLKIELINEIRTKYNGKIPSIDGQEQSPKNEVELAQAILERYKGAKNAEIEALREFKNNPLPENAKKLRKCQVQANKFYDVLLSYGEEYINEAKHYAEGLIRGLIITTNEKTNWGKFLPECHISGKEGTQGRQKATNVFDSLTIGNEENTKIKTDELIVE